MRERDEREREKQRFVVHLCIHRLLLVCVLTGDGTYNLGVTE